MSSIAITLAIVTGSEMAGFSALIQEKISSANIQEESNSVPEEIEIPEMMTLSSVNAVQTYAAAVPSRRNKCKSEIIHTYIQKKALQPLETT